MADGGRWLRDWAGPVLCLLAACGPGEEPEETEVDGEYAYTIRCGYCHDVPNGIGAQLTPRVLASYSTVGGLDRYLRFAMPHETPGSLPSAEYDAILAYLIESRELVEDGGDPRELPPSTELRVIATGSPGTDR
ncbi:MAG: cytochrome c [Gemmatimonadetes bacterium]|nr:cytochrome c [Gemmatimonadota bacterium]MYE70888.1 cytochrome c [Gemmatimonadota bacterium]MYJ66987.1 cytochrome c [Gemmatimonadota bacterium]